jgi:hypothetical protein
MPLAKGGATAGTGRRTPPPSPRSGFRLPAAGSGQAAAHRSLWDHSTNARHTGRHAQAGFVTLGDTRTTRDFRRSRQSCKAHDYPRTGQCSPRIAELS